MNTPTKAFIGLALITLVASCASSNKTKEPNKMSDNKNRKAQVVALLNSIESGDQAPIAYINAEQYIQHNPGVADGLAGFGAALAQLPEGSARAKGARVFEDGDFVVAHTDYNFFGPKIGFDIFRFENGLIVEHWDNLQETAGPNPSGHSMIDGPSDVVDVEKTAANKGLVENFVNDILVNGEFAKVGQYIGETYIQHNPQIGDGLSGLQDALKAMAEAGIVMRYNKVHKILGEANFVLTVSEGSLGDKPTSFYDLFRIENGMIVEHWDVVETLTPASEHKHSNGKFGF